MAQAVRQQTEGSLQQLVDAWNGLMIECRNDIALLAVAELAKQGIVSYKTKADRKRTESLIAGVVDGVMETRMLATVAKAFGAATQRFASISHLRVVPATPPPSPSSPIPLSPNQIPLPPNHNAAPANPSAPEPPTV